MAGTGLYWGRGESALRSLAEPLRIPVFLNGQGRGCLPADHELCFSRARSAALKGADVALVIGVPLDFRLGFGAAFADDCELIVIDVAERSAPVSRGPSAPSSTGRSRRRLRRLSPPLMAATSTSARGGSIAWPRSSRRPRRGGPGLADDRSPLTRCGSTASSARCSTATRS